MKLFIAIFGEIRKMAVNYGSNYAVLISKDVSATRLTTAAGGLPVNEISLTVQLTLKHEKQKAIGK